MSHFSVMVVGDNIGESLYPYWELDLKREELRLDPRATFCVEIGEGLLDASFFGWKREYPDYQKKYGYKNANKWVKDWFGYDYEPGLGYGNWQNPKAKWDWWEVGGRFSDKLINKEGITGDSFLKKEIDFAAMERKEIEGLKKDYLRYKDQPIRAILYNIDISISIDEYVKSNAGFATFAAVKDGEWHERGKMGWWAITTDEKDNWQQEFNRLLADVRDDERITIVDCHI